MPAKGTRYCTLKGLETQGYLDGSSGLPPDVLYNKVELGTSGTAYRRGWKKGHKDYEKKVGEEMKFKTGSPKVGQIELKLREIDIKENIAHQTCEHEDVHEEGQYIGIVSGVPYMMRARRVWFGWNMQGWVNPVGIQLNGLERLFEVLNTKVLGVK